MNFKFYKTTDTVFISKLNVIKENKDKYTKNIELIKEQVGAKEWLQYSSGSVACFHFDKVPCKATWKKSESGFLPKLSNKEGKKLNEQIKLVKSPSHLDSILEEYNFPRMVMGEATRRGISMHSSHLCGKFKKGVFFVKVPQEESSSFVPPTDVFTEVKEWEMLKFMEEE